MVELALIMPVILVILLGVIALFGALGARQDLEAAVAQGARIGALEGNGGINCQTSGVVPMTDTVDTDIISAITTTHGVLAGGITQIQIYQADLQGQPTGSKVNTYSTPPFTTPVPFGWPPCMRDSGSSADSIGVRVSYRYHPSVMLPGFSIITIVDQAVQRINPAADGNPCPFPGIPILSPAVARDSTTDNLTWIMPVGLPATSYHVYSAIGGANGDQFGGNPLATGPYTTTTLSDGTTQVQTTVPVTTMASISYQVAGVNYCGEGERSLSESDSRMPPTPTDLPSPTFPPTPTASKTATPIAPAATPTVATATATTTATAVPSRIADATATSAPSATATATAAPANTATGTAAPPATRTATATAGPANTATGTSTSISTSTPTGTSTSTSTAVPTPTGTATATAVPPPTATRTATPVSGFLAGSVGTSAGAVNLTTGGTQDWAYWGRTVATDFDYKATGLGRISNYTIIGGITPQDFTGVPLTTFSWSDGTPTGAASGVASSAFVQGAGHGFQITVPAGPTQRTLKIYLGSFLAKARLSATLSDASAPAYVDTSLNDTTGSIAAGYYTLTYRAATNGQTLTVQFTLATDYAGGSGAVGLQAATLTSP